MTPLAKSQNLAARMGRWSASHRKTAIFGWLAFVVVAIAPAGTVHCSLEDWARFASLHLEGRAGRATLLPKGAFQRPEVFLPELLLRDADALRSGLEAVYGAALRQRPRPLKGRCGACHFKSSCGGNTRIRALQLTGDPWEEDPACYLTGTEIGLAQDDRRERLARV